ncbi:MAG: DUF1150 family protein [Flavobacteriaceae bacterium]
MNVTEKRELRGSAIYFSQEQLAALGMGEVAYVKPVSSEDLPEDFRQEMGTRPGEAVYALHQANGEPILIAQTRDLALAGAMERQLAPVTLH